MPFRYRLQKFLEIRIKKKEEQILAVIKAQAEVNKVLIEIDKNKQDIKNTIYNMKQADPHNYEIYDNFLKHLYEKEKKLLEDLQIVKEKLKKEEELLKKREQEVDVLEKHKDNLKEEYFKEQKQIEMKQLNEVGSQKHFRTQKENEDYGD